MHRACERHAAGSPPHTRGILELPIDFADLLRFTPAYAGNTRAFISAWLSTGVHPRIRGEYQGPLISHAHSSGSPPHTRGILLALLGKELSHGFTPAYAGNTGLIRCKQLSAWVHPRIRGEYEISGER